MLGVNLAWFILALIALIIVHEAGHMIVAKWVGMWVEKFSIFFGRPLWRVQRGETEYAFGWIPLGGYVKITGFNVDPDTLTPEEYARAYDTKKPWQRIAVILAGPAVNILLAFVLFAATFMIGVPQLETSNGIGEVREDSVAQQIGLQPGDRVVAIDGKGDGDVAEIVSGLRSNEVGDRVTVTYVREGGEVVKRTVTLPPLLDTSGDPVVDPETNEPVPGLGVVFARENVGTDREGPVGAVVRAGDLTQRIVVLNGETLVALFTNDEVGIGDGTTVNARESVSGPIRIGAAADQVADQGIASVIFFIAFISLALGIFNLLPLLPLDGGHIAVAMVDKLSGGRVPRALVERLSLAGFVLLIFVGVLVAQQDVQAVVNGNVVP